MPKVTLIAHDGRTTELDGLSGQSVMQVATAHGFSGIVGECGGSAMCATCHVYVEPSWVDRLHVPLATELEMLECTASERKPESRLSCQIKLSAELDGLVLHLPETQQWTRALPTRIEAALCSWQIQYPTRAIHLAPQMLRQHLV